MTCCVLCVGTGQDQGATCVRCKGRRTEPDFAPGVPEPAPTPAPEGTTTR